MLRTRHLYLARHAEPRDGDAALTDRGARQAELLGRRLADVPFAALHHGPLARAEQTARLIAHQLSSSVPVRELGAAGDSIPHVPSTDEVGPQCSETVLQAWKHRRRRGANRCGPRRGRDQTPDRIRVRCRRHPTSWWSPMSSPSAGSSATHLAFRAGGGGDSVIAMPVSR